MASNPYGIHFPWRNVVATVALALALWGVPFAIWPTSVRVQQRVPGRAPMKIRYLGRAQGVDGSAWSPVVFPLPTKYGFSEKADASALGHDMKQVFQPRVSEGVFLALPVPVTQPADVGMLEGSKGGASFRPAAVRARVFAVAAAAGDELWRLDMDDFLQGRQFIVDGLQEITPDAGVQGSVEAYVELDRSGIPQHVLLDSSSGNTNLDRSIVRALYSGRGRRGADGGGRVRLFYWRAGDGDTGPGTN